MDNTADARTIREMSVKKLATGTCAKPLTSAVQWNFAYEGDGVCMATMRAEYAVGIEAQAFDAEVEACLIASARETERFLSRAFPGDECKIHSCLVFGRTCNEQPGRI
jgi:hypothetical protein